MARTPGPRARREFEEELGSPLPDDAELRELGEVQAKEREGRGRVGGRGRPRRHGGAVEHVRAGVAPAVGPAAGVPRDRSCGVVRGRAGAEKLLPAQVAFLDRLEEVAG